MNPAQQVDPEDGGELVHDFTNHLHVVLGNLELLQLKDPQNDLIADALAAAEQMSVLLRKQQGTVGR